MKKQIFEQAVQTLSNLSDITRDEFYFLLASFVMYFQSPLYKETWNTFPKLVEQGKITVQDGLFTTDEEKNPETFKKKMNDILFDLLLKTKKKLQQKVPFTPTVNEDIILIPDVVEPTTECTLFPKQYLKKVIDNGIHINELTGHPFAWYIVEAIKLDKPIQQTKKHCKKISSESLMKYIQTDIDRLSRLAQCCIVCKCSTIKHKSMSAYQCIYFCSFKCMEKWEDH